MTDVKPACQYCHRTEDTVPLFHLVYAGKDYYICPQHFPLLVHEPESLVGVFPGAENLEGHHH